MSAGSLRRPPYSFFALILHEIQWMLPPFVFAGLLAYIATPAIDWATARTRLPRPIFVFLVFALFLLLATLVAYLGIPPLAREMTHVFNDFETIVREVGATHDRQRQNQPARPANGCRAACDDCRQWFAQLVCADRSPCHFGCSHSRHDVRRNSDADASVLFLIGRTEHGAWIVAAGTATPAAADRAYLDGARSSAQADRKSVV